MWHVGHAHFTLEPLLSSEYGGTTTRRKGCICVEKIVARDTAYSRAWKMCEQEEEMRGHMTVLEH